MLLLLCDCSFLGPDVGSRSNRGRSLNAMTCRDVASTSASCRLIETRCDTDENTDTYCRPLQNVLRHIIIIILIWIQL